MKTSTDLAHSWICIPGCVFDRDEDYCYTCSLSRAYVERFNITCLGADRVSVLEREIDYLRKIGFECVTVAEEQQVTIDNLSDYIEYLEAFSDAAVDVGVDIQMELNETKDELSKATERAKIAEEFIPFFNSELVEENDRATEELEA